MSTNTSVEPQRRRRYATTGTVDWDQRNKDLFRRRAELIARVGELEVALEVLSKKRSTAANATKVADAARQLKRAKSALDYHTGQIVEANYGLVREYVRRFVSHSSAEDTLDFEAAARVGLIWAINTYDPERGKFSKWAHAPIKREVHRIVNQIEHPTLSNGDFAARPKILRKARELGIERPFGPDDVEKVAEELELSIVRVAKVLNAPSFVSINQTVSGGGDEAQTELGELIDSGDPDLADQVAARFLYTALEEFGMSVLTPRERFVLIRREGVDGEPPQVLASLGEMFNVSREAARQQQLKALAKLSHPAVLRRLVRPT